MAVDAVERNALSVEAHKAVLYLKAAEADSLPEVLDALAGGAFDGDAQGVEIWLFCAPEGRGGDGNPKLCFLFCGDLSGCRDPALSRELIGEHGPFRPGLHAKRQLCKKLGILILIIEERADLQILHMHLWKGKEGNASEDPGEPEHVLVLQPGA